MNLEKEIFDIDLNDIMPNRFQPREIFEDEALDELSESIKKHGVIQPIIVRKIGDKYEIIAGERRYRASQKAGKKTIPALVRDIDDKEAAKIALLENLQRKDLTPIEEAKTYQTILKIDNITQEELAQNLGKSQSTVANKLRLLNLAEEVQTALLNNKISERHARSLLNLPTSKQPELLQRIVNERLTVKQVDEEVQRLTGEVPTESVPNTIYDTSTNVNSTPAEYNIQPEPQIERMPEAKPPIELTREEPQETDINIIKNLELEEPQIDNSVENVVENNNIEYSNSSIPIEASPETADDIRPKNNIFDRLRIPADSAPVEEDQQGINTYDLRFAINNFRQAIQNTEKFGLKVKSTETDMGDKYQILVEIEKK